MTARADSGPTFRQIMAARVSLIAYEKMDKQPPADIKAIAETPLPHEVEQDTP
ncbi:MAG TPA: hypothetical protein PLZ93_23355 [Nocardioides sp.]|uniref:hypothetical protein n=1 Tax=uncultured Nocardioides sp. TaxID=198441 RepID=UPI002622A4E0|nr:hypothetical protein [uncultured Nocardioides sp.]HRD60579.1 hypothetical protein [Nocardioides sp.]HRI98584.1 hypothetical protein [Nocardioides sp.]HRK48601.1 hypothetical protein [Nocardioides sp.]